MKVDSVQSETDENEYRLPQVSAERERRTLPSRGRPGRRRGRAHLLRREEEVFVYSCLFMLFVDLLLLVFMYCLFCLEGRGGMPNSHGENLGIWGFDPSRLLTSRSEIPPDKGKPQDFSTL